MGLLGFAVKVMEVDHVFINLALAVHIVVFNLAVLLNLAVVLEDVPLGMLPGLLLLLLVAGLRKTDGTQALDSVLFLLICSLHNLAVLVLPGLGPGDIIVAFLEVAKFLTAGTPDVVGFAFFVSASFGSSTEATL